MTYCVGMVMDEGLVFLSDSRTNAGVDQINSFRKLSLFERAGDRVLALLSAGNLAITQAVVAILRRRLDAEDGTGNLMAAETMFDAAALVGEALRTVHARDARALKDHAVEFNASFILGGQIRGEPPRLFSIYAAGNFIEATADTRYFQIGESKYGKPIIDRMITANSSLKEAAKCALVSMDSTIRSNLSVGPPLDLVLIKTDELAVHHHARIDVDDDYFNLIRTRWGRALKQAFAELPDPPFV
jgi:putative proteasome-type protease